MKLKLISGIYPTNSNPYRGCFIYERLKQLQNHNNIPFTVSIIENSYSKVVSTAYRIIKSKTLVTDKVVAWDLKNKQQIIPHTVSTIQILNYLSTPIQLNQIKKIFDKMIEFERDDIMHAHWVYPHGYIATLLAKKHNIPCIVTAHGSDIHTSPRKNRTIKKYTLKTLNSADKVIFVSHALLDSAKELGYSGENAVVIPNGIDMKYFYPMEKEEALKRTGYIQTKRYVVGFVGNLIPVKRADKFVEIFSEIQKRVIDVEFILVGDGDLADAIRSGASDAGLTVTFAGRVPHEDVCCWMNLFDVMILPSRNEGWPCVVLEAFGCGTPVVGSQNGGVAEAIGGLCPSVADGEVFEKRFADAVCQVLTGEYTIDTNCLTSRAKKHTWEATVEKEIDVYMSIQR